MDLSLLPDEEDVRETHHASRPVVIHRDHRWLLPILHELQLGGHVPRPCKIISFDAHHDALAPIAMEEVLSVRADLSTPALVELCSKHLKVLDDDWLKAGMELGLISDAIFFGVRDTFGVRDVPEYVDKAGVLHRIELRGLPGDAFEFQGDLSDVARRRELQPFWDVLGWEGVSVGLAEPAEPWLLDLDLDCFVMDWQEFTFPWPTEIWTKRFFMRSEYSPPWTGRAFFDAILRHAGAITIATEPNHCGGPAKARALLSDVNYHLFDDNLSVDSLS